MKRYINSWSSRVNIATNGARKLDLTYTTRRLQIFDYVQCMKGHIGCDLRQPNIMLPRKLGDK